MELKSGRNPMYEVPGKYFSDNFHNYLRLLHLEVRGVKRPCLENDAIFLFVEEGDGRILVNGIPYPLKEGTFCFLHSFHVFQLEASHASPLKLSAAIYDYPLSNYFPNQFTDEPDQLNEMFYDTPVVQMEEELWPKIRLLFKILDQKERSPQDGLVLMKASALGQLMILVRRAQCKNRTGNKKKIPLGWNILLLITKFNGARLTIEDVMGIYGIDETTVNRELRAISGYDFYQLLNRAKINSACSNMLMGNIATRYLVSFTGFSSESAFYRAFITYRGVTPQVFRERMSSAEWGTPRFPLNYLPRAIFLFLLDHFQEDITIQDVVQKFYTTEANVNASLKDLYGMSFRDILLLLRLRNAESLLKVTRLPVLDVALQSGWNSIYTFLRQFKAIYGITPTEFKKWNRL